MWGWPPREPALSEAEGSRERSESQSRQEHEIRQDRILDRRPLGRFGAIAAVFYLRSHRPPGSATHHPSCVLLWLRRRRPGLPGRIPRDYERSGTLPPDDDSFDDREVWRRLGLRSALPAASPHPGR